MPSNTLSKKKKFASKLDVENHSSEESAKFLRYESSTLIPYKELSSTIFQSCQWVSESGMRDTLPDLHFAQYIKV